MFSSERWLPARERGVVGNGPRPSRCEPGAALADLRGCRLPWLSARGRAGTDPEHLGVRLGAGDKSCRPWLRQEPPAIRSVKRCAVGEEPTAEQAVASPRRDPCSSFRRGAGHVVSIPVGLVCFLTVALLTGALQALNRIGVLAFASSSLAGVLHFVVGRYRNFRASQAAGVNLTAPLVAAERGRHTAVCRACSA